MTPDLVLGKFKNVKKTRNGWLVSCPCPTHRHGDRNQSLSIRINDDGSKLLVHCRVGDRTEDVLAAAGLKFSDLYINDDAPDGKGRAVRTPLVSVPLLDQALQDVIGEARRRLDDRELEAYAEADAVRNKYRLVAEARRVATGLGDCDRAWGLLSIATMLETDLLIAEES